jgi:hypothetical protein
VRKFITGVGKPHPSGPFSVAGQARKGSARNLANRDLTAINLLKKILEKMSYLLFYIVFLFFGKACALSTSNGKPGQEQ